MMTSPSEANESESTCTWKHENTRLSLSENGRELLAFCLDPTEAKTFLHPVRAPGQDTVLTDCYPADHIWHRGVWWSWKYINDLNYWEENKAHQSEGLTRVDKSAVTVEEGGAVVELDLTYLPPGGEPVLREKRHIQAWAPRNGVLVVDYTFSFTAVRDARLRATAVPGEPDGVWYGGYAGFSVRRAKHTAAWDHRDSEGRAGEKSIHGQTARWVSAGGAIPDGAASLTVLSHPENPRTPEKWYVYGETLPYFSPAILMGGALHLKQGQTLACRYRLLVANTVLSAAQIDAAYASYINQGDTQ